MSRFIIRFALPVLMLGGAVLFSSVEELPARSRRAARQRAEALSYQQAGETKPKKGEWVDPNATVVRGTPRAQLNPSGRLVCNLSERRAELQRQVDMLGAELRTARGPRARKITKELAELANQIAVLDRKLESLPQERTFSDIYSSGRSFRHFVDSLVDLRIQEEGYVKGPGEVSATERYMAAPAPQPQQPAIPAESRIIFRIQVGLTARPSETTYSDVEGIRMVRRPDGKYAYYYGAYPTHAEAQAACRHFRATHPRYRDAFVVALQGGQRISVQEAMRLTGGM